MVFWRELSCLHFHPGVPCEEDNGPEEETPTLLCVPYVREESVPLGVQFLNHMQKTGKNMMMGVTEKTRCYLWDTIPR